MECFSFSRELVGADGGGGTLYHVCILNISSKNTTLHYSTQHYTTLHYTTLHYTVFAIHDIVHTTLHPVDQ